MKLCIKIKTYVYFPMPLISFVSLGILTLCVYKYEKEKSNRCGYIHTVEYHLAFKHDLDKVAAFLSLVSKKTKWTSVSMLSLKEYIKQIYIIYHVQKIKNAKK
uniref:Uncharacterized protein n=1 Tax=Anguilla anguilla TaxID=7936 RepID=A0A0E9WUI0_ANGAN